MKLYPSFQREKTVEDFTNDLPAQTLTELEDLTDAFPKNSAYYQTAQNFERLVASRGSNKATARKKKQNNGEIQTRLNDRLARQPKTMSPLAAKKQIGSRKKSDYSAISAIPIV